MAVQPGEFDFLVLTSAVPLDANLAIAGSRAGALGVLNLEFARERDTAFSALARLLRYGSGRLGVLLDARAEELLADILSLPAAGVDDIILTASALERLPEQVRLIHERGRRVWLVVTSPREARAGLDAGVDALIAKGHEAGGWVGEETSFILVQQLAGRCDIPVYIHGGVGLHTAAACVVGGAAGAVLDSQLLLAKESPAAETVKARLRTMDGSETACLGTGFDARLRVYARPGMPAVDELRRFEATLLADEHSPEKRREAWRAGIEARLRDGVDDAPLPLGQDAAFAADLARRFVTVGGILAGLRAAIAEQWRDAAELRSLAPESPLAQFHGTRYPIVQGPMTRVSDTAEFATEVAEGGALPFLALALLRGPEVETLLEETRRRIGDRPWGVGILGFVPPELRAEQLKVVQAYRPPFALIAGGRPDQARVLEAEGIHTYLHVPSPGLLQLYLREGARRFVFEGRECGGHVGPRTSFVLWDTMVRVLLEELPSSGDVDYCVLFAGGIHDGLSAAMVAAIAAPLAKRGVRLGVLIGTAYLFTEEAVRGGAITAAFQQAALACEQTVLLE
ncbi:MAG TPA: nitronate monooxygenase, partial [Thermomicrobiaceae bacterium]|nr:nitronate monooxygenase [Thermomicrobiaceae bacterium]